MVDSRGFEPLTPRVQGEYSTSLNYKPNNCLNNWKCSYCWSASICNAAVPLITRVSEHTLFIITFIRSWSVCCSLAPLQSHALPPTMKPSSIEGKLDLEDMHTDRCANKSNNRCTNKNAHTQHMCTL